MISFNRINKNKLIVIYEPWVHRFWASVRIQRWIRGVLFRSKQIKLFAEGTLRLLPNVYSLKNSAKTTYYAHYALITRAIIKI